MTTDTLWDGYQSLSPVVARASTILFPTLDDFVNRKERAPDGYSYGLTGTPTHREFERRVAHLEGAKHSVVTPSGQAAISLVFLSLLKAGDHLLLVDSAYGPAIDLGSRLAQLGIEVEHYAPSMGSDIESLIRPNTRLIWMESPGSMTMEIQDVPAIVAVAKRHGVLTGIDNSWAGPSFFQPLALDVDMSVVACSKYLSGHADLLLGVVSTNRQDLYTAFRASQSSYGMAVSPDDCFLAQRGLDTLPLRMQTHQDNALMIAKALEHHPLLDEVLHPALSSFAGHELWKKQFSGSSGLFALRAHCQDLDKYRRMFGRFSTIKIGASYGGGQTLAAFYPASIQKARCFPYKQGAICRFSIGYEDPQIILTELQQALEELR
ncbi:trans-sulfuration enzyme family protein [Paenalcaligenes sp. Me52]|uniref:trans-sulfuration enzyme family protein n=1 Tax=Paenalcaligenes sp. Me52 TaxID=3392038 RepID=UPI003D2BBE45